MGYSISVEQYEKLERNRREGRMCWVSTGRGGCFNRATVWVDVNLTADGMTVHVNGGRFGVGTIEDRGEFHL